MVAKRKNKKRNSWVYGARMNFPKWAEEDGKKLADLILEALHKKEILTFDDIFNIYDNCGFSVMRKTEGVAWRIINPQVERIIDEDEIIVFRLKD